MTVTVCTVKIWRLGARRVFQIGFGTERVDEAFRWQGFWSPGLLAERFFGRGAMSHSTRMLARTLRWQV